MRRKKKAPHRTATTDDKRLQNTLKRLSVNTIPGIEEVNLFMDNNNVLHFSNPKGHPSSQSHCLDMYPLSCAAAVQASITANTYVVSGTAQTKSTASVLYGRNCDVTALCVIELSDLLPEIITQMGPDSLASLKRMAEQMQVAIIPLSMDLTQTHCPFSLANAT